MKKSILITGCSKGFGLLFAEELAKDGHRVYATVRDLSNAQKLIELTHKYKNIQVLKLDVTNPKHLEVIKKVISHEEKNKLDVLINNAGYGLMGRIDELDYPQLLRQFETNTLAPLEITKHFLPLLNNSQNNGLVINISSIASFIGLPSFGAYSSSKAALNNLSMALAIENAKKKLSVVVIEPGPFDTEFSNSAVRVSQDESYMKARSGLFPNREDPIIVSNLVKKVIAKKDKNKLGAFSEIPVGRNSNFFRIISRWLPLEWFVGFISRSNNSSN